MEYVMWSAVTVGVADRECYAISTSMPSASSFDLSSTGIPLSVISVWIFVTGAMNAKPRRLNLLESATTITLLDISIMIWLR